jgi:tryptophan-rich sensory protein
MTTAVRRGEGLSSAAALLAVAGVLGAAGLFASRYSPDPRHPRIQAWYSSLDKPAWKPPDPLFGAIWPALEALHSWGAYRLMRGPRAPGRDAALALWVADIALASGWAAVFFGRRSTRGAVAVAALQVASAAAYCLKAARLDRVAAWSAVPFLAWTVFGGAMSENLRERDQPRLGR